MIGAIRVAQRWEGPVFFRKATLVTCAVCGKAIEPKERRFVEKNRMTKVVRHTHPACRTAERAVQK